MKIRDLIDNDEFHFNARYRIYKYESADIDEEGELTLVYDSETDIDYDWSIGSEHIVAINQATDGALEIEYVEGWTY